MKLKKVFCAALGCAMLMQNISAFAYDTSPVCLFTKHREFASQYEYKEGDELIPLYMFYPQCSYTSGIEPLPNGKFFELPATYLDEGAIASGDFDYKPYCATKLWINGKQSDYSCSMHKSKILVPVWTFKDLGCDVTFDENTYVATIKKGDKTLEILPYLIGMRLNGADGFYIPLSPCARFSGNTLMVPLRLIADVLGFDTDYISEIDTVDVSVID